MLYTSDLHGHIHESYYKSGKYVEVIDNTISVNPGQEIEALHAAVIQLGGGVENVRYIKSSPGRLI